MHRFYLGYLFLPRFARYRLAIDHIKADGAPTTNKAALSFAHLFGPPRHQVLLEMVIK
jgi:hypothetical protein